MVMLVFTGCRHDPSSGDIETTVGAWARAWLVGRRESARATEDMRRKQLPFRFILAMMTTSIA